MPKTSVPSPKRYARWRAVCLIAVHLLIGIHIAHWKIAGRTLAPLELNEVMHTLELGVVTAGFLLGTLGRVSEAEPLLRHARTLAPGWPLPCYNLVALLDGMDRAAEAESLAATCPSASPGDRR